MKVPSCHRKYVFSGILFLLASITVLCQTQPIDSLDIVLRKGHLTEADRQKIERLYIRSNSMADSLYKAGSYRRAANIYHRLFIHYPDNESPVYNAACCYGLLANADSAILELELKFSTRDYGVRWRELSDIKADKDFLPLAHDPKWKKYIANLELIAESKNTSYSWGILFGVMVVLFFYNLFLYISIRDVSFLYYSIMLFVTIHFEAIRSPAFGDFIVRNIHSLGYLFYIEHPFPFLVSAMTVSNILFVSSFMKLREILPKSGRVLNVMIVAFCLHMIFAFFFRDPGLAHIFEILTFVTYIYLFNLSLTCWLRKKYKPARFFVLAAVVLTASMLVHLLHSFGINIDFKLGVYRPDNIGLLFFMTLLSFALGDRINLLAKEKAEAQEKALEVLEEKVKERTKEVVEKSKIIEEKNEDILASITYARRIQKAQLPTEKYLDKIFSRFKK